MSQDKSFHPSNIAIFGMGYVGCVTAACFTSLGHTVVGVDRDQHKINDVVAGRAPFYEPGLQELVSKGVSSGLLTATQSTADALKNADVALICVGTPSERNGNLGQHFLCLVAAQMGKAARRYFRPRSPVCSLPR